MGHPVSEEEEFTPKQVAVLDRVKVVQVSAGDCHTVALASNGGVYCWGIFRVRRRSNECYKHLVH